MSAHLEKMQACHKLLESVLQEAYHMDVLFFHTDGIQVPNLDRGMRDMMFESYSQDSYLNDMTQSREFHFVSVKSNLGFYNVIVIFPYADIDKVALLSVGPFRDVEVSPSYFNQIVKDTNLPSATILNMKYHYEGMPQAPVSPVANITKQIITHFFPEFANENLETIQYTNSDNKISVSNEYLTMYNIDFAEKYKKRLAKFLEYIQKGDLKLAQEALKKFLHDSNIVNSKNPTEWRHHLHSLNHFCQLALMDTTVNPAHILRQGFALQIQIDTLTSQAKLMHMPNDICHKYCILVKNHANPDYSKTTRDVMSYVQLHLEEDISLSFLAEKFGKNASTLSSTFSKDTGTSLTSFIHETRVKEATRLFNTTEMSISDVALAVGYQDFSYFSKIFTKHMGRSPRVYKQERASLN